MEQELKSIYENTYKNKKYAAQEQDLLATLEKWEVYKQKIISGSLSLTEYTNRAEGAEYLTNFLEHHSKSLGRSRAGAECQIMVKMNTNLDENGNRTYNLTQIKDLGIPNRKNVNEEEANVYYETYVLPLLQQIVRCNSINGLIEVENSPLYKHYNAKQLLEKIMVLESTSRNDEFDFKLKLGHFYSSSRIYTIENVLGLSHEGCRIERNYRIMQYLYTELLDANEPLENKIPCEISRFAWDELNEDENNSTDDSFNTGLLDLNIGDLYDEIDENLSQNKQIVLTGAPGTGKTYTALTYAYNKTVRNEDKIRIIQFHSSYDYTDFVEGLRPAIISGFNHDTPSFVKLDGELKDFCRYIVEKNYEELKEKYNGSQEFDESLYKDHEKELKTKYYLIIDEINRADLSRVFGEIMSIMENSYRGILHRIKTQYNNMKTYFINEADGEAYRIDLDVFDKGFFIPTNLYIIGTMNDIDRSVESFDFALRRRFNWLYVDAIKVGYSAFAQMFNGYSKDLIDDLNERFINLNSVIINQGRKFGLNKDYCIGHAYFKNIDLSDKESFEDSLSRVFNTNIISILREYTRGRPQNEVDDFISCCAASLDVTYDNE